MVRDRGFSYESSASDPGNVFAHPFEEAFHTIEPSGNAFDIGLPPPGFYGQSYSQSRSVVVRPSRRATMISQASSVRSFLTRIKTRGWALKAALRRK